MILPYASDNLPARRPYATLILLAVTLALSCYAITTNRSEDGSSQILSAFGIVPDHFNPLTLLSYPLFHAGVGHFLVNAFYLWLFGAGIEVAVGSKRFLLLYFAGGAVGGLLQWLVTILLLPADAQSIPIVGASAACATLIGLYAVRYYRATLRFVGLPFRIHVVLVVTLFLIYEIGTGVWNLLSGEAFDGVAHWAHSGGFIFGLGCAHLMRLSEAGARAYLTQDASQAMLKNVPGAAIKKWEELLTREPKNAQARCELGRAWLMLGDREQAKNEYMRSLVDFVDQLRLTEAATLYVEMRELELTADDMTASQFFALGSGLIDVEQYALATETLRCVFLQHASADEAEMALLEAISLYVHQLDRHEEARICLRLFFERHSNSPLRPLALDLRRIIEVTAAGKAFTAPATENF